MNCDATSSPLAAPESAMFDKYFHKKEGAREAAQEFKAILTWLNKEGMTGLKDPGIGLETWKAYQEVLADGDLPVRVFA